MSTITLRAKDGRTQTFDERETVRRRILERAGWRVVKDKPLPEDSTPPDQPDSDEALQPEAKPTPKPRRKRAKKS